MTDPSFLTASWTVALLILAVVLFGITRLSNWRDRFTALGLGIAGFVALFLVTLRAFLVPFEMWNIARLAVTISWIKGYHLYYPPNHGPIENHIYGPFAALAYLPAGFAHTPTNALLIAGFLAAAWFFIPAAWLIWRCNSNSSRLARCAAICIFALLAQRLESLRMASSWVHADAPALGLAACSLAILSGNSNIHRAILVSLFALLAVWTKQSIAPVFLVLPCWIALRDGFKSCARFCCILAVVGSLFSAICLIAFGPSAIWFNMFVEPSHHPWQYSVGTVLRLLAVEAEIPAIFLAIAMIVRQPLGNTFTAKYPYLLPLLTGIAMIPTALLGWIKHGGAVNNASLVTYFLLVAACCALADCESWRWAKPSSSDARFACRALLGLLSLFLAWWIWNSEPSMPDDLFKVSHVHRNVAETDFRFERRHPGRVYFPWDPLAALMASGKLYHFDYSVTDRIVAGFPPSDQQLHEWVPPDAQWIALPPEPCASFVMQTLLPEFAGGTNSSIDELPGYILVKRNTAR